MSFFFKVPYKIRGPHGGGITLFAYCGLMFACVTRGSITPVSENGPEKSQQYPPYPRLNLALLSCCFCAQSSFYFVKESKSLVTSARLLVYING